MAEKKTRSRVTASFRIGAIALVFMIIGFQTALFVYKASVARIVAVHDHPDTVYVADPSALRALASDMADADTHGQLSETGKPDPGSKPVIVGRSHVAEEVKPVLESYVKRSVESFRFNPNTVSSEDLQRLGFSEKQAASIVNYREKGGRFRRKEDFSRCFVVADSVYRRLEPFIDIPLVDINEADSAAFDALPGIGPFFASKMVSYREELHGYSYPEQLMDIWHFDREKYDGLKDLIEVGECEAYPLWTLPEEELRAHPYIGRSAHAVVLWRSSMPTSEWTVDAMEAASVLPPEMASKLSRCRLALPPQNF